MNLLFSLQIERSIRKLLFQSWHIHISFRSFSFRCRTLWHSHYSRNNASYTYPHTHTHPQSTAHIRMEWRVYRVCCHHKLDPCVACHGHGSTALFIVRLISSCRRRNTLTMHDDSLAPTLYPSVPPSSIVIAIAVDDDDVGVFVVSYLLRTSHMYFLNNCFCASKHHSNSRLCWFHRSHPIRLRLLCFFFFLFSVMSEH